MTQPLWLAQLWPIAASQLSPSIPDCWVGYNSNPLPAAAPQMLHCLFAVCSRVTSCVVAPR